MIVLGLGEKASIAVPPQVNGGYGDYITANLRAVAACTDLPYEEAFSLYANLNFQTLGLFASWRNLSMADGARRWNPEHSTRSIACSSPTGGQMGNSGASPGIRSLPTLLGTG